MKVNVAIVDDHALFLNALSMLIDTFHTFDVALTAKHGKDFIDQMQRAEKIPDIVLLDVNMPVMDGKETAMTVHGLYPDMKMVALSMNDDDQTVISMIKAGCCAYIVKDTHPNELERALNEISTKGYYNGDQANIDFRRLLQVEKSNDPLLSEREREFIQWACSDITYKQIASHMAVSERTVDGYRASLFEKLNVHSRVGIVIEAIRRNIVEV